MASALARFARSGQLGRNARLCAAFDDSVEGECIFRSWAGPLASIGGATVALSPCVDPIAHAQFEVSMSSINPGTANSPPAGPATGQVALDGGGLHVLRLCLDLQLDALLLTVGAASSPAHTSEPPWLRWVNEDVRLACSLTAGAHAGGAGPPSGLGSDLDPEVPSATEDGLHARYTSMETLLSGLISRPRGDGAGREDEPGEWRSRTAIALVRCRERLAELERRAWRPPVPRATRGAQRERPYLPGELLG
jgi:hypothetical protein